MREHIYKEVKITFEGDAWYVNGQSLIGGFVKPEYCYSTIDYYLNKGYKVVKGVLLFSKKNT